VDEASVTVITGGRLSITGFAVKVTVICDVDHSMIVRFRVKRLASKLPRTAEVQTMKSEETPTIPRPDSQPEQRCLICCGPATRLVDGDPSCETHANQVYQEQVDEYIRKHIN
jgi:hypothetical protein